MNLFASLAPPSCTNVCRLMQSDQQGCLGAAILGGHPTRSSRRRTRQAYTDSGACKLLQEACRELQGAASNAITTTEISTELLIAGVTMELWYYLARTRVRRSPGGPESFSSLVDNSCAKIDALAANPRWIVSRPASIIGTVQHQHNDDAANK